MVKKRFLFVCLGNICRSPAAEAVFNNIVRKNKLDEYLEADSAGTGAWHVGNPADSRMRQAAQKRGIFITSTARQIDLEDFSNFDFIIAMDSENLSGIKSLENKCFITKKPVIRLMLSYSKHSKLKDVPDPYYGGDSGFEKVLDLLEDACQGLLDSLNPKE